MRCRYLLDRVLAGPGYAGVLCYSLREALFLCTRGTPVRPGWITLLFTANIGLWLAVYAPIQVLLPEQAQQLDKASKTLLLSVVMGAVAALIANPIVGAGTRTSAGRGPCTSWSTWAMPSARCTCCTSCPTRRTAAPLLGVGFGTYWAAAPAVLTEVLPAASDRAKDLGVINIATALPLVVAPLIAGLVLSTSHSYPALFALSALATLAGGGSVLRIRAVR